MKRAAIVAAVLCACHRQPAISSCDDDLRGVWRTEAGQTWMILDGGDTLEIYPLFADVPRVPELEVAPRVIELRRADSGITGELHRRYMRHADACDAKIPARITACSNDAIDIVLADPVPPIGFAPCVWGRPNESRRERWHRD